MCRPVQSFSFLEAHLAADRVKRLVLEAMQPKCLLVLCGKLADHPTQEGKLLPRNNRSFWR